MTRHDDDRIAASTPRRSSAHLLRDDADNDIGRQSKEGPFGETNEYQDVEEELVQSPRNTVEEIDDTWRIRQASENAAKSRASKSADADAVPEERASAQIYYLAPTTMRGVPLADLTSKPETRGFYITADVPTSAPSTTSGFLEGALIADIFTPGESAALARSDRRNESKSNESESDDVISEKDVDTRGEKSVLSQSSEDSGAEDRPNHEEHEAIVIPVDEPPSEGTKSRGLGDYNTWPLPYVAPSTLTSVKRKFPPSVSPEIFDDFHSDDHANFARTKIDDPPSTTSDPTTVVSTISDYLATIRATTTGASIITSAAEAPAVATDERTFAITSNTEAISATNSEVTPTIIETAVLASDSVIATNIGVESAHSASIYSTDLTNTPEITNAVVETNATDIPAAVANDSGVTSSAPANIRVETAATANYSTAEVIKEATSGEAVETAATINSTVTSVPTIANANAAVASAADAAIPITNMPATSTEIESASTTTIYSTLATIEENANARDTTNPVVPPLAALPPAATTSRNDRTGADGVETSAASTIADSSADPNVSPAGTTSSAASTTLAIEYSTIDFAGQNTLGINEYHEYPVVAAIATTTGNPIFSSASATSKLPRSTDSGASFAATAAFSTRRVEENTVTATVINTDTATTTYEPDSAKPEIGITLEEAASGETRDGKQDRTSSHGTADYHFGQKRRVRVVNRKQNWLGRPVMRETNDQYPPRRPPVAVYRGRPRTPPSYASFSRVIERNRGSGSQSRVRVHSEPISGRTPDEHTTEIANITERAENVVEKRMKTSSKAIGEKIGEEEIATLVARKTIIPPSSPQTDTFTKYETHRARENESVGSKRKVISKRIKSQSEEDSADKINVDPAAAAAAAAAAEDLSDNSQSDFRKSENSSSERGKSKQETRVSLKSVRSEEANADFHENLRDSVHVDNTRADGGGSARRNTKKKNVGPELEGKNSTIEAASANSDSTDLQDDNPSDNSTASRTSETHEKTDESFKDTVSNDLRRSDSLPVEYGTRRRKVLKNVQPKSEGRNVANATPNSIIDQDPRGSFPNGPRTNEDLSRDAEGSAGRKTEVVSKSVKPEERDSIAEETNAEPDVIESVRAILTSISPSEPHVDREDSNREEGKATIEQPEDTNAPAHRLEQDTDRSSLEVTFWNNGNSINRKLDSGNFNRRRKLTQSTTTVPFIKTLPSTVTTYRRVRPSYSTLSPRIDFVDALEVTDSYIKVARNDQKADVSVQNIRAQEFADPSDTGRTALRDALSRRISTTITPRTDPYPTSITVTSHGTDLRSQGPRTKERPRRPPVDYDYYEDEVPLVVGKSNLNTKLFLTSKGTIRCLDQGNFPHPYSCKKFITCARMVNGQVIGTEYTCPNKLSFDPVGGICNWSAGLGCKD